MVLTHCFIWFARVKSQKKCGELVTSEVFLVKSFERFGSMMFLIFF